MIFSPDWRQWYDALEKPAWTPPPATVGLIWQVLYPINKSFARTTELSDIFKKNMAAQTYYELLGVSYDADE